MPSALGRGIDEAITRFNTKAIAEAAANIPIDDNIPLDPQAFYRDFGLLRHPRTNKPVGELTGYQADIWRALHQYKRVLAVKSNKIGLTTSTLLMDFQLAILPTSNSLSTRGMDTLVIAQTVQHAAEHLRTLRKLILGSKKYKKYLITKPTEAVLRDEATKIQTIYIHNPETPSQPSRLIGLGLSNSGSLLSWKNVKHLHLSDATATTGDISEGISAAFTRLANTEGTAIIESVPSGPSGRIYELYQQYKDLPRKVGSFAVFKVTCEDAIAAGIMTNEFIEQEKQRLGILFPQFYMAEFVAGAGNIFSPTQVDLLTQHYDLTPINGNHRILAVDPAFGSSKFAIVGLEKRSGIGYIIEARQFERPTPTAMLEFISGIFQRDHYHTCYVDSAHTGLILDLNNGTESRLPVSAQPVVFREELGKLVMDATNAVRNQRVRIHPSFSELITQLKSAQFNEKGHPDKSKGQSLDLLDAFMMAVSKVDGAQVQLITLEDGIPSAYDRQGPIDNPSPEPVWTEEGFRYV